MKLKTVVLSMVAAGAVSALPAFAASSDMQLQLNQLKAQQMQLQKQVASLQSSGTSGGGSMVSVGKVGGEFISSNYTYGRNFSLLKSLQNAGNVAPLVFGGLVEATGNYASDVSSATEDFPSVATYSDNTNTSSLWMDRVYFDTLATINDWMHVETQLQMASSSGNDSVLRTGNVLLGNFDKSPVYMTVGRSFVDFGSFSSLQTYSDALTKTYFGPAAQTNATLGYYKELGHGALHMSGSVYRNANTAGHTDDLNDGTVTADYAFNVNNDLSASIGGGWINDISGNGTLKDFSSTSPMTASDGGRIPAYDVNTSVNFKGMTLLAEFDQTTNQIDRSNLSGATNKKVSAYDVEAGYSLMVGGMWDKPVNVGLGYSATKNMDGTNGANPMKNQWALSFGSYLDDNEQAYLGLEVDRLAAYATGGSASNATDNTENFWVTTLDMTVKF